VNEPLIQTKAGPLYQNDEFWYHRERGVPKTGWLKARSADALGRWVNGVDANGRTRTIELPSIIRIRKPGKEPLR